MTSKVILYIATSLDGCITDKNNSVDFLSEIPQDAQVLSRMNEIMEKFDFIIMGNNTFNQITTELSTNDWPYKEQKSFVYTHNINRATEIKDVDFTDVNPRELIAKIKQENKGGKDIWLLGGANLVKQFHDLGLIDEYIITVTPIILGEGLKLFPKETKKSLLNLREVNKLGDCVELTYSK